MHEYAVGILRTEGKQVNQSLLGGAAAFVFGALLALVNYLISRAVMRRKMSMFSSTAVIRQLINIGGLVALYFIAPHTPFETLPLVIGGVLGETLPMLFFTFLLLREGKSAGEDNNGKKGE